MISLQFLRKIKEESKFFVRIFRFLFIGSVITVSFLNNVSAREVIKSLSLTNLNFKQQ